MPEDATAKRLRYAKESAKKLLEDLEHTVLNSDNKIICFTATFGNLVERKIRIVTGDEISDGDIKLIKKLNITGTTTKEIWLKKEKMPGFKCVIFDKDNNLIEKMQLKSDS